MPTLAELAQHFAILSLIAFGGANATLPEVHRLVVDQNAWLSPAVFSDLFALSQAAPGPNVLLISLIGLQLHGLAGFLTTTVAFCLPSSLLMYFFNRWWSRQTGFKWRTAVQDTVGSLSSGLVLASGWLIGVDVSPELNLAAVALTVATVWLLMKTSWHPLWLIAAGAALGVAGLV
jgi:chromate transporter